MRHSLVIQSKEIKYVADWTFHCRVAGIIHTTDAALGHVWTAAGQKVCTNRLDQIQQTMHTIFIEFLQPSTHTTAASPRHQQTRPHCVQRAQTSANAKISTKGDPGFQSGFPDYSGSRCLLDPSENVLDSFPCWQINFTITSFL